MSDGQAGDASVGRQALRVDARDNRARLIAVAREVFAEHGVQASLRDIARRAGVGIGTLYRHFPDREALLEALLRDGLDTLRTDAENLVTADGPGEAVIEWLIRFATGSATYRGLPSSVLAAVHDEGSPLHTACRGMMAAANALLVRAQEAGAVGADVTIAELCALGAGVASAGEQVPNEPDLAARLLRLCAVGVLRR